MTEPDDEENEVHQSSGKKGKRAAEPAEHEEKSLPAWVKTTGAIVGVIVALTGAIVGFYQVVASLKQIDVNIERERKGSEEAKAKQAEEDRKKAEEETRRNVAETAGKLELRKKDFEIKSAELAKEMATKAALMLSIKKDEQSKLLDEQFKVAAEKRTEKRDDNLRLSNNLTEMFKEKEVSLAHLATLTPYTTPGDERLGSILTPLVAKLDETKSPAEVSIIFQLFERSGPEALAAVIDSNRNALEKYKSDATDLAWLQFKAERSRLFDLAQPQPQIDTYKVINSAETAMKSRLTAKAGLRELASWVAKDVWQQIQFAAGYAIDPETGRNRTLEKLKQLEIPASGASIEGVCSDMAVQLAILNQSKRALLRLLKQTQEPVDLTGTELSGIRFVPGLFGRIDFSEAYIYGADFTAVRFDDQTSQTLGEAYGYPDEKLARLLKHAGPALSPATRIGVRLSETQREIILQSASDDHRN